MDAEISEKLASSFAVYAVQGDRTALEKAAVGGDWSAALKNYGTQAADQAKQLYGQAQPYLADPRVRNALIGAGAGGLVGLMQPKRKMRNALTYGLVGGLGGAGLTYAFGGGQSPATNAAAPNTAAPAAGTAPAAGQVNKPVQTSSMPYPITPEGRAKAEDALRNSSTSPVTGGQLGAFSLGAPAALAAGRGTQHFVTKNLVKKDWNEPGNAARYLYELAKGDGKTLPNGAEAVLTQTARTNILGDGKLGKGGRPGPGYIAPSITLGADGKHVVTNDDRFNAAKAEMMGVAKPTAEQRLRGNVAGTAAGASAGILAALLGRSGGEALWNAVNRQKYPSAF
jgi:hypothetical protein